jgi:aldose sugar dehydrogenase
MARLTQNRLETYLSNLETISATFTYTKGMIHFNKLFSKTFDLEKGDRSLVTALGTLILILSVPAHFSSFIQPVLAQPSVRDSNLSVHAMVEGLSAPTSMTFLDDNNILVLEKEGSVRLVTNGTLQDRPLLQIPVNTTGERGLLGVAISTDSNSSNNTNIFLYYTEGDPARNRIYKYQWNGETLFNPALILDLPADPVSIHNGGKMVIGHDGYLYAVIGDQVHNGQLQNFPKGNPPDYTGSIFRINPKNGSGAPDNPFVSTGEKNDMSKYYAYGIRNSFGMDIDPLTGNLWDTENGPDRFDEINLVRPGFNSGSFTVFGPISLSEKTEDELVKFLGSHYADPLFSWADSVAPTDIEFFRSSKLGDEYATNIFIGDIKRGNLYLIEVNENRDGTVLDSSKKKSGLSDLVANSEEELSTITFGRGFGGITDIETGPDGFLYVLSYYKEIESPELNLKFNNNGTIYKISSK